MTNKTTNNTLSIHTQQIKTPLGPMIAAATKDGICFLEFIDRVGFEAQKKILQKTFQKSRPTSVVTSKNPCIENQYIEKLKKELSEYFRGKRTKFTVPLTTLGTGFQMKAWDALTKIPYGETRSYKDQAIAVGNKKAVRAVARANSVNKIAILIPCHRVIGSNGKLTGYAGGLDKKQFLLDLEKTRH